MKPTLICFLSWCNLPNCLSNWMRAPFPNGFVKLAWNANVGYSWDRWATHFCCRYFTKKDDVEKKGFLNIWKNKSNQHTVIQVGTKSHLFKTNIMCLWLFSFLMNCSTCLHLVPSGFRASSTWIMTSDESITYTNKRKEDLKDRVIKNTNANFIESNKKKLLLL